MFPMKKFQKTKGLLHPRNLHQGNYPLEELSITLPELKGFLFTNDYGTLTLDFSNAKAVKCINQALLKQYYEINYWDIPEGFLCPPIPGRADYIHYLADLLSQSNGNKLPKRVQILDIGTGANLIYPILGSKIYNWDFIGSEINPLALEVASEILRKNLSLQEKIKLRYQANPENIFEGIIQSEEFFDLCLCNPPFHDSAESARNSNLKKLNGLIGNKRAVLKQELNFGGQAEELWTAGGEIEFIRRMIFESIKFKNQIYWFTCLVSKAENMHVLQKQLENSACTSSKVIPMSQGNKQSRFITWTFLNQKQQESWKKYRWT
jgi:23S rRNA (adenine1618-N6)-methyltransferase